MASVNVISAAELLAFLGTSAKSDSDPNLDLADKIIGGVTGVIERITGLTLGQQSFVEKKDGNRLRALYLVHRPVVSITSIKQDGQLITLQNAFDAASGRLSLQYFSPFTEGWQNWEVSYVAGLGPVAVGGAPAFPEDLKTRAKIIAAEVWKQSKDQRFGVSATSFGGQSINFFSDQNMVSRVEKLFADYVLTPVGD